VLVCSDAQQRRSRAPARSEAQAARLRLRRTSKAPSASKDHTAPEALAWDAVTEQPLSAALAGTSSPAWLVVLPASRLVVLLLEPASLVLPVAGAVSSSSLVVSSSLSSSPVEGVVPASLITGLVVPASLVLTGGVLASLVVAGVPASL
jgi:glucose/arabinose dehydrogenase